MKYAKLMVYFLAFLAILISFKASTIVLAANDTVTIDVNVTETSSIIVLPETLNWTSTNTGSEGGIKNLTIKNSGSVNVTDMHVYVDTLESEPDRPYGSSDPTEYSAGGVLTIRNESGIGQFFFTGRIEWNWTQDIPNHDWSNVTNPVAWGYFRNTSNDYVWVAGNGTTYGCNDTDAEFAIVDDIDLGTAATRAPDETSITRTGGDENYSYFEVDRATAPLFRYCVAIPTDCSKLYIYYFDKRAGFTTCGNSEYIKQGPLAPGDTNISEVNPYIPTGIPSGYLNTTILTVIAS